MSDIDKTSPRKLDFGDNAATRYFEESILPLAEKQLDEESQERIEHNFIEKAKKIKNPQLRKVIDDVQVLWDKRGQLKKSDLLLLVGGILYLISPIDAIPDFIPVAGYIDDLAVLAGVVAILTKAISFTLEETKKEAHSFREESIQQARLEADNYMQESIEAARQEAELFRQETIQKVDEMIDRSFDRTLSGVVLGLWGITTAVALTLLISTLTGRIPYELYFYTLSAGVLVAILNIVALIDSFMFYRSLDEEWQTRLAKAIIGKISIKRAALLLLPLFIFSGLIIARFVLN